MLAFTENKKKQTPTVKRREDKQQGKSSAKSLKEDHEGGGWASTSTANSTNKPAWHDHAVDKLSVRIEDSSRLRKLKKEEAEQEITGEQYAQRLQEYYNGQTN